MSKVYYIYIAILLFFTSCASFNKVSLEVLQPSEFTFKTPVKQLAIINNAPDQAAHIGHTNYKQLINYKPNNKKIKTGSTSIQIDSTNLTCLYNLYNKLNETQAYEQLYLIKEQASPSVAPYSSQQYFNQYKTDALLVLERMKYQDNFTSIKNEIYNVDYQEIEVIVSSDWSLYFSINPTQAYNFNVKDTLYWEQRHANRADCVSQTLWKNGASTAKKISPYWQEVKRYYYTGTSYIYKEAELAIKNNDWQQAASLWKKIYDGQKKENKAKARMAYNMALYFEYQTDFESALSWLKEAINIFKTKEANYELVVAQEYNDTLKERQAQQRQIEQHLGL